MVALSLTVNHDLGKLKMKIEQRPRNLAMLMALENAQTITRKTTDGTVGKYAEKGMTIELHELAKTVDSIKGFLIAQNCDLHVLAIKKLVVKEQNSSENVFAFGKKYFKQKLNLVLMNADGLLCLQGPPSQRQLNERLCTIVMLQLHQHDNVWKRMILWYIKA